MSENRTSQAIEVLEPLVTRIYNIVQKSDEQIAKDLWPLHSILLKYQRMEEVLEAYEYQDKERKEKYSPAKEALAFDPLSDE